MAAEITQYGAVFTETRFSQVHVSGQQITAGSSSVPWEHTDDTEASRSHRDSCQIYTGRPLKGLATLREQLDRWLVVWETTLDLPPIGEAEEDRGGVISSDNSPSSSTNVGDGRENSSTTAEKHKTYLKPAAACPDNPRRGNTRHLRVHRLFQRVRKFHFTFCTGYFRTFTNDRG